MFYQTVLGVGSATLGVTRAYVAEVTATRQRTTYIAWLTAVQYGGFTGMFKEVARLLLFQYLTFDSSHSYLWGSIQLLP